MRFHHAGLEVQDLFEMERFYRVGLGFRLAYRYESRNTPGLATVFLEREGFALELLSRPRDEGFLARRSSEENHHLALEVDDVEAERTHLLLLRLPGVTVSPARDTGDGFREAEVRDPEGNVVELAARVHPPPRDPLRAVIFDFDGTVVDSEPNYYYADRDLLARHGLTFTEEDKKRYVGCSNKEQMVDLVRRHQLPVDPADLAREKNALYLGYAERETPVFPEMRRFLDRVRARGLPVALASGSGSEVLARVLAVTGLAPLFDVVLSADEVPRGKPAPDVFLEAARRLGVPPRQCLVLEDSRYGVEAALRGSMRALAIPYLTEPPIDPTFHLADLLFEKGMSTFDAERAFAWVESLAT